MKGKECTRMSLGGVALCAGALALSPPIEAKSPGRLAREIETILKRQVFAPATVAIDIRDLGTGQVLYERNATLNVKPASTMKLFTTAAILDAEGPLGAAGATTLETAGRLDSLGRVLGDLYLIGRGDPNLSDRFDWRNGRDPFDQLAKDVRDAGITRIEGGLVGYDGLFSDEAVPDNWTADDLVWSYGAAVTALSAFDSSLRLRVEPGELDGDVARLFVKPETDFVRFENRIVTAGEGRPAIRLKREPGARVVVLEGAIPRVSEPWTGAIAAPEPTLFAATLLAEALGRRGVSLRDAPRASRNPLPDGLRPLASLRGPSVAEQIRVVNKESQNLHAETLLRRLGLSAHKDASVESSLRAREMFLKGLGVRVDGAAMSDGSGLSRANLVTARAVADLLAAMAKHPHARTFRDSLPIAGVDGSLRRRMAGTSAQGRVFAKTGAIRHVNALGGYVDTVSGRRLAFAILVNHHTRPAKEALDAIDAICALLAELR